MYKLNSFVSLNFTILLTIFSQPGVSSPLLSSVHPRQNIGSVRESRSFQYGEFPVPLCQRNLSVLDFVCKRNKKCGNEQPKCRFLSLRMLKCDAFETLLQKTQFSFLASCFSFFKSLCAYFSVASSQTVRRRLPFG